MFSLIGLLRRRARHIQRRGAERFSDGSKADIEVRGVSYSGRILDVSFSGVRFLCLEKIAEGRTVVARVEKTNHCTHLALRVVWVAKKGNVWEYGAVPDPNQLVATTLLRAYTGRFTRCLGEEAA